MENERLSQQLAVLDTKLDWLERRNTERHAENAKRGDETNSRLASIEREVRVTNGRVTKLELKEERREEDEMDSRTEDGRAVTIRTLKHLAQYGGWIAAAITGYLHLIGKL